MFFTADLMGYSRPQTRHFFRRLRLSIYRRPKFFLILALVLVTLLYLLYQIFAVSPLDSHDDSHLAALTQMNKCSPMSAPARAVFELFVRRIITTLDLLKVTHFMCYDSLWTALRRANSADKSRPLRLSDGCFNLCVLNEDLMRHDDSLIERRFRANGIALKYQHGDGIYIMSPNTKIFSESSSDADPALHPELFSIHARVHVFEKDSTQDMYRRVGWKNRMLPSTMCTQLHCFPSSLVDDKPLPQLAYAPSISVNVPREGIEIQKYHYPDKWWNMANSAPAEDECDLASKH